MSINISELSKFIRENFEDLEIDRFSDECLYLEVRGECMGCPYREFTIKDDVEEAVKTRFPQIKRVSITAAISDETLNFAKRILGADRR